MPLIDRLTSEALTTLCVDCPEKDGDLAKLSGVEHLQTEEGETVENPSPNIRLGMEVTVAARLVATMALKEELGCSGRYLCDECDQYHCGAQKEISLDFAFGALDE